MKPIKLLLALFVTLVTIGMASTAASTAASAAVGRDAASLQRLLDGRGEILLPEGTFVAGDLIIYGNTKLIGVPGKTVIKQAAGSAYLLSVNPGEMGTADPGTNEKNIEIRGMIFEGRVVEEGFSEHAHTLNFNAVTDLLIDNCTVRSFRGDGIYLGSGNKGGLERHNLRVVISNCLIDGTNKNNRNGISVIDGTDITISRNTFRNCSRPDMPGAIDIEPNAQIFHVIRDIEISDNFFSNIGGGLGLISVVLPFKGFRNPPKGIRITGNVAEAKGNIGIHLGSGSNATAETPSMDVLVEGNVLFDAARGLRVFGMRGVTIRNNIIDGTELEPLIGYNTGRERNLDLKLIGNIFRKLGRRNGIGLNIFGNDNLVVERNVFIDCGRPDGSAGSAISLRQGQTTRLRIADNHFFNLAGVMKNGPLTMTSDHRLHQQTFNFENNRLDGMAFTADQVPAFR